MAIVTRPKYQRERFVTQKDHTVHKPIDTRTEVSNSLRKQELERSEDRDFPKMTRCLFGELMLAVEGKIGCFSQLGRFPREDDGGPGFGEAEENDDEEKAENDKLKSQHNSWVSQCSRGPTIGYV